MLSAGTTAPVHPRATMSSTYGELLQRDVMTLRGDADFVDHRPVLGFAILDAKTHPTNAMQFGKLAVQRVGK